MLKFITCPWPDKATLLNTFVKKEKSISFPKKAFDPCGGSSTEKEEGVRDKKIHLVLPFNDGSKGINSAS